MPRPTYRECQEAGQQFVSYLEESGFQLGHRVYTRDELRAVYNQDFRERDGQRRPNFSSLIYSLHASGLAQVRNGNINLQYAVARPAQPVPATPPPRDRRRPARTPSPPAITVPLTANKKARRAKLCQLLRNHKEWMIADKNGISVTGEPVFVNGHVGQQALGNEAKSIAITIRNQGVTDVELRRCEQICKMRGFSIARDSLFDPQSPLILPAGGEPFRMLVTFRSEHRGLSLLLLVFEFLIAGEEAPFHVARSVTVEVCSEMARQLQPSRPYEPRQRRPPVYSNRFVVPGVKPDPNDQSDLKLVLKLENFPIAKNFDMFSNTANEKNLPWMVKAVLEAPLTISNYKQTFHHLLHLDELQMMLDIRAYDIKDQTMEPDPRNKRLLKLRVPGVAENRPSVLRGDKLVVNESAMRDRPECVDYVGYVHDVQMEDVVLGFGPLFMARFVINMKYDVMFTFNRTPLRLQHRAVDQAVADAALAHVLFPSHSYDMIIQDLESPLTLYNRILSDNAEQSSAVQNIVSGISRPAPYLIYGPPGTGKTVTLVESIRQVVKCIPGAHVLACAPSNSAADLICQQLLPEIGKNNIYRLNAYSRDWKSIPGAVKACSNWDRDEKCFWYPKKDDLMKYKVMVTTLITAGRLVSAGFRDEGHFSHVFVDEAGQALEPECLVAVAGLLRPPSQANRDGGQLVLAGDPKQLGPIIRSLIATKHHLGKSLIERLMMENPLYKKSNGSFNPSFVTKLINNYRSHPAILELPNALFYENELQVCADELTRNRFCQWEHLPTKGFPVIFHSVFGQDIREENSPSFFNVAEVEEVVAYVKKILDSGGKKGMGKVSPKEIGIIAPYRKQVQKIKKAITQLDKELKKLKDIEELKIGSVEEFQGQERTVIIISTVRSDMNYFSVDQKFSLGFLRNPKRFNVALTRAKALLVMIGNPVTLSKDPNWERLIEYCRSRGGFTGEIPSDDDGDDGHGDDADDDDATGAAANGIDDVVVNEETEWRREM